MKKILFMTVILLSFLIPFSALADTAFSADPDEIEQHAKSVLMLEIYDSNDDLIATGSGFVVFNKRTMVTNYHVIEDASLIMANSDDGDQYFVTSVLIADPDKDIAICGFFSPTDLTPLELNGEQNQKRAQNVVAIGSPIGITNTVSIGNISAVYMDAGVSMIQFTAPISHGSSGGALFDDNGRVIGMTSAYYVDTQNLNLAVHASEILALYEQWDGSKTGIEDYLNGLYAPVETPTPEPVVTATPAPNGDTLLGKWFGNNKESYAVLSMGDSGEKVTRLQEGLISLGYLTGPASGIFDAATEQAVKNFKRVNYKLTADSPVTDWNGTADEKMQKMLFEGSPKAASGVSVPTYTVLSKGDSGDAVTRLQEALISLGYLDGPASGSFDAATEQAVKNFKRVNYKLTADSPVTDWNGTADEKMQKMLFEGSPKAAN